MARAHGQGHERSWRGEHADRRGHRRCPRSGIAADLLTCLARAHAEAATVRDLPNETAAQVFTAWDIARRHIDGLWTEATDPANLQPRVPKPMRDAAALITRTVPAGMTRVEADGLVNRLNGSYNLRIQAVFRCILRSDEDDEDKAARIAEAADEFGLQAAPTPEPLPAITIEDVNLVCWLAVTSS